MPQAAVPPPPVNPGGVRTPTFKEEVIAAIPTDSKLETCIQCGTCGGSCPSARDMDHTPRRIFALIRADARDKVMDSNTPFMCVACYLCAVRCPQQIHIPDVMYALKTMATREGRGPVLVGQKFSQSFVENIHKYGRSFEVGLVTRHYLRYYVTRLPSLTTAGLGMMAKGRMGLTPQRIKGVDGLNRILDRAGELELAMEREALETATSGGTH